MLSKKSLLLVLAVALAAVAGITAKSISTARAKGAPAFTIFGNEISVHPDGRKTSSEQVRYVSANGNTRSVVTDADGHVREYFFENGRGSFVVSHQRKLLFQDKHVPTENVKRARPTADEWISTPGFTGTQTVLGYKTYVIRTSDSATGEPVSDLYFAEEFGRVPLKVVLYSEGKVVKISEPSRIELGEPRHSNLKSPDYPVAER